MWRKEKKARATRKLVLTLSAIRLKEHPCTLKEPFLRMRGSGRSCTRTHQMQDTWQLQHPRWLQCCVIVIKKKDKLMVQDIGIQLGQHWWEHLRENKARDVDDGYWLMLIHEGSNKMRIEYCEDNNGSLCYLRAIQGHSGIGRSTSTTEEFRGIFNPLWGVGGKESDRARQSVFFTPLNPSGDHLEEEERHFDYTVPQKVHKWNLLETQSRCGLLDKIKDCDSDRQHHLQSSLTPQCQEDCIDRVTSQNGDRVIFERLAAPRPAPKVTLKSYWQTQQQHQQQPQQPTLEDDVPSIWKQRATWESRARVRDDAKHAMEAERAPRKLVLAPSEAVTGEEAPTDTNTKEIERIKIGSNKICIREDQAKEKMVFSKETSHAISEMGNEELLVWKKSSIQCLSWFHYVFEGTFLCNCGGLLKLDPDSINRTKEAFEILKALCRAFSIFTGCSA